MEKNKKTLKNRSTSSKGGKKDKDLTQKYSLESLNQSYEVGGFSYSNVIVGFLAVGALIYMIQQKNQS